MKWVLASISALILISSFLAIPSHIYPEWQIISKAYACSEAVRILNRIGYKVLLGESDGGELSTKCMNDYGEGIYYCLFIPGTQPPEYLIAVGKP